MSIASADLRLPQGYVSNAVRRGGALRKKFFLSAMTLALRREPERTNFPAQFLPISSPSREYILPYRCRRGHGLSTIMSWSIHQAQTAIQPSRLEFEGHSVPEPSNRPTRVEMSKYIRITTPPFVIQIDRGSLSRYNGHFCVLCLWLQQS